jgi:predicted DNA-binding protein YlxM (UPF0122 family)
MTKIGFNESKQLYRSTDLLRNRINLLRGKDKLLMTMYLEKGNSFRQMARLAGVTEACIARRIHKLMKRLIDSEYITCLRNRKEFNDIEMHIAKDYFLLGQSMRKIAENRQMTYYQVRKILRNIQAVVSTVQHGRRRAGDS